MPTAPGDPPADPDALLAAVHGTVDSRPAAHPAGAAGTAGPPAGHGAPAPAADSHRAGPGTADGPTRIRFTADGPALIEGPVELVDAEGNLRHVDRFQVAICLCKRSRTYPLCDTGHRRRRRAAES